MVEVLHAAKDFLVLPGNDFAWSSWENADAAVREIEGLIAAIDCGRLPLRLDVEVLFAPTGPIQEVSLSSGWAYEFLALSTRFDAALDDVYGPQTVGEGGG